MLTSIPATGSHPNLFQILETLHQYLHEIYPETLEKVILFGSQARGDAQSDSDIDILIVLKNNFNDYQESQKISHFVSDHCLNHDVVITCFFTSREQWQTRNNALFRNIRREGVAL